MSLKHAQILWKSVSFLCIIGVALVIWYSISSEYISCPPPVTEDYILPNAECTTYEVFNKIPQTICGSIGLKWLDECTALGCVKGCVLKK